jgi:NADH dehydrogenase
MSGTVAAPPPDVVILGGGFGGLAAARALRRACALVTVVDRRNHHLFQPLLYQVATAALNPSDVAHPIRAVLRRQRNARVLLANASAIDLVRRIVVLDGDELHYDYLIVATGATHAYFGHDEWEAAAPGLKTIEDALEIRRRVLLAYEAAERETDPERVREWLTFVVVGAGPTGVELAGALSEIARFALADDFRTIDPAHARVLLFEGGPRVLPTFSPKLSAKAQRQLERLGVQVRCAAQVTAIDDSGVSIGSERIAARTVLWAAGVRASPLARSLGVPLDRAGRVPVGEDLAVAGHQEVFVIGDLAAVTAADGSPVPGVAPAAVQGGKHAAACIRADLAGRRRAAFRYRDRGNLATIGRAAAVVRLGRLEFGGWLAWMVWLGVHVFFLIGFRNRFFVMLAWAWSYVTFRRGARLITGAPEKLLPRRARPTASVQ